MAKSTATTNTLVIMHEGNGFNALVCGAGGELLANEKFLGNISYNPPKNLFDWAKKYGSKKVVLLAELSISRLRFSLPAELEDYEIEKTLGFEYSAISNGLIGNVRGGGTEDIFSGANERLYVFGLAENELATIKNKCREAQMEFRGVAPLALIWIMLLSKTTEFDGAKSFLYVGNNRSLLCMPARIGEGYDLRSIAVGSTSMHSDNFQNKFQRYFADLAGGSINILSEAELPESFVALTAELTVAQYEFEQSLQEVASYAATEQSGPLSTSLPLVRFATPGTGKFNYGHSVAAGIILVTVMTVFLYWLTASIEHKRLVQVIAEQKANDAKQKTMQDELKKLSSEVQEQKHLISMLSKDERVDDKVVEIINGVCEVIPRGIRLTAIEKSDEGTKIHGRYVVQADMAKFGLKLQENLSKYGFRVVPLVAGMMSGKKNKKALVVNNQGDFTLLVRK